MMANFEEKLRERGITLWLASLNPEALAVVERSPVGKSLNHKHMFFNLEQAVEASQAMQDGDAVS
jgi:SulP family sulfate permease